MNFHNLIFSLKNKNQPFRSLQQFVKNPSYAFSLLFIVWSVLFLTPDTCYSISTEALRETMRDAKSETFSWMFLIKVAAAAVGSAVAVFKQSPAPFGLGIGTTIGIHMWDKYLGDGSSALI